MSGVVADIIAAPAISRGEMGDGVGGGGEGLSSALSDACLIDWINPRGECRGILPNGSNDVGSRIDF